MYIQHVELDKNKEKEREKKTTPKNQRDKSTRGKFLRFLTRTLEKQGF